VGNVDLSAPQRVEQGLAPVDLEGMPLPEPVDNLDTVRPLGDASSDDGLGQPPQPVPQPER
jgi:hypothetical protein